jgi:hypothetical protein
MIPDRRGLLVLGVRGKDPKGSPSRDVREAQTSLLRSMIDGALAAADEGRMEASTFSGMSFVPTAALAARTGGRVVDMRGRARIHVRFSSDGPFFLTGPEMTAAIVASLRRPIASDAETEAELDVLGAIVAGTDMGTKHGVACSATPWQEPLITGETPMTMGGLLASSKAMPTGLVGLELVSDMDRQPVEPGIAAHMADVVHVSNDGGDLLLSPLRVEGPRTGFVFKDNIVTCHRTGPLPDPMETLRILGALRAGDATEALR